MQELFFTHFLNQYFGGIASRILSALGAHPIAAGEKSQYFFTYNPAAPITNFFAMELLVVLILLVLFIWARTRISVDSPGTLQHVFELAEEFVNHQSEEIIPAHGTEQFTPFLVALALFILISNLIGLIPGFVSPTATPAVPLGLAIVTWFYYHFNGIKKQGIGTYAKHFMGPVWWLAWLMIPIEVIGHFARLMSLTKHLCGRSSNDGLLLLNSDWHSGNFPRSAPIRLVASGLHFRAARDRVPRRRSGGRALGRIGSSGDRVK